MWQEDKMKTYQITEKQLGWKEQISGDLGAGYFIELDDFFDRAKEVKEPDYEWFGSLNDNVTGNEFAGIVDCFHTKKAAKEQAELHNEKLVNIQIRVLDEKE